MHQLGLNRNFKDRRLLHTVYVGFPVPIGITGNILLFLRLSTLLAAEHLIEELKLCLRSDSKEQKGEEQLYRLHLEIWL